MLESRSKAQKIWTRV